MSEHQDLQRWFQILLPFEMRDQLQDFQSFLQDMQSLLPFEMTEQHQTLQSWFQIFLCFEVKAFMALTEEERRSVEEEKQLFFNKIGLDEDSLKDMLKHGIGFFLRAGRASTDEELQSIEEDRDRFFKDNENYMTALDKYIREKKQKSTAPAA